MKYVFKICLLVVFILGFAVTANAQRTGKKDKNTHRGNSEVKAKKDKKENDETHDSKVGKYLTVNAEYIKNSRLHLEDSKKKLEQAKKNRKMSPEDIARKEKSLKEAEARLDKLELEQNQNKGKKDSSSEKY